MPVYMNLNVKCVFTCHNTQKYVLRKLDYVTMIPQKIIGNPALLNLLHTFQFQILSTFHNHKSSSVVAEDYKN